MTNPTLVTTPFANDGVKNTIPESAGAEPQNATMQKGFPDITQVPISAGGIPPERADFNGILNLYGQHVVHLNKGLPYEYDATFASQIGGYPLHARIMLDNGNIVRNTINSNTANPNNDMTGWYLFDEKDTITTVESVADLRGIAGWSGRTVQLKNYKDYRNGGLFIADTSDKTSTDDGAIVIVSSEGIRYKRQMPEDGNYQIDWWFDPATDTDDYSKVINKCSEFFDPAQGRDWGDIYNGWDWTGTTKLCPYNINIVGSGGTRKCVQNIILNAWTNNWDFKSTELDFSAVISSGNTHFWIKKARQTKVGGFTLKGGFTKDDIILNSDGTLKEVQKLNVGIYLHTNAQNINGVHCSNLQIDNVIVTGVAYPVKYGNNAYLHKWNNVNVYNFFAALSSATNPFNSGENIKFNGGVFANGFQYAKNFKISPIFDGTSFDYSGADTDDQANAFSNEALWQNCDDLKFIKCHLEWGNQHSRWKGAYFNSDNAVLTDTAIVMAEDNYLQHNVFCKASLPDNAIFVLENTETPNMSLNGNEGSLGNGQRVEVLTAVPANQNMWKNFRKTPKAAASDFYINSITPKLSEVGADVYQAATRCAITATDAGLSSYALDAASNSIVVKTSSTVSSNTVTLDFIFDIRSFEFYSFMFNMFPRANNADTARVVVAADIYLGTINSSGNFVASQRATWTPTANSGLMSNNYSFNDLNAAPRYLDKGRLRITFSNFYSTGNPVEYVIRSPIVECISSTRKLTHATH